jgi:hypothetical protein
LGPARVAASSRQREGLHSWRPIGYHRIESHQNKARQPAAHSNEDTRRKAVIILLFVVFAVAGLASLNAVANGKEKTLGGPKQGRWHGVILRIDKDNSTMDVRKGNLEKKIHFDSSTK